MIVIDRNSLSSYIFNVNKVEGLVKVRRYLMTFFVLLIKKYLERNFVNKRKNRFTILTMKR